MKCELFFFTINNFIDSKNIQVYANNCNYISESNITWNEAVVLVEVSVLSLHKFHKILQNI